MDFHDFSDENAPTISSKLERSKTDYSQRLPEGWKKHIHVNDQGWIGQQLFVKKGEMVSTNKLWWYPPQPPGPNSNSFPNVGSYFGQRFFLWMPQKMWGFKFKCPSCSRALTSKGPYTTVREIIDLKDRYYMGTQYLECVPCKGTHISWDPQILDQLPQDLRSLFPAILTRKYSMDVSVISLMRSRTVGNSPTSLCNDVNEIHSQEWIKKVSAYLGNCMRHKETQKRFGTNPEVTYARPPQFPGVSNPQWFLATYVRDVYSRIGTIRASITSVYGTVLKIDSTKKITKKLQGTAANSAAWCTNVGNEKGQVLVSLLTTSESLENLQPMADGLMARYEAANQSPPTLLYTDRDCCNQWGQSKFQRLFHQWPELKVRMDSWHFIRRLGKACVNESHPLYATFMAGLSAAIFEWDPLDVELLSHAKNEELKEAGMKNPSPDTIKKAITKSELAKHCKRKTRGVEETTRHLQHLFDVMQGKTDTLGVPLLVENSEEILQEQLHHVNCLQDPEGLALYMIIGTLMKAKVVLPVYRCARGTTSLESFHLHVNTFIPGTSANDVNFQVYLLEGLARWNGARASAALEKAPKGYLSYLKSFDISTQDKLNTLSSEIFGEPMDPNFRKPAVYTGELFGVEYLYSETNEPLSKLTANMDNVEEGSQGVSFKETQPYLEEDVDPELDFAFEAFAHPEQESANDIQEENSTDSDDDESPDHQGKPGWDKVCNLANALVNADPTLPVSDSEAKSIIDLYHDLSDYDKRAIQFNRFRKHPAPVGLDIQKKAKKTKEATLG